MNFPVLQVKNVSASLNGQVLLQNITFTIQPGEHWAIIGASGAGKTSLAKALTGRLFFTGLVEWDPALAAQPGAVLLAEQQHQFKNLSNTSQFYYQQRFNSFDAEDSQTVSAYLAPVLHSGLDDANVLLDQLHLLPLLQKPLIQLSNGENKRLQLASLLLRKPAVLIMDNPFLGLDAEGRATLHTIMDQLVKQGMHLVLITHPAELPAAITHVAVLHEGKLVFKGAIHEYDPEILEQPTINHSQLEHTRLMELLPEPVMNFSSMIRMQQVSVRYGDNLILNNVDWEVKPGERWHVSGPNGAGKSTLLSLISGDNPQAYSNQLWLFDRRRGSGESIWDIKRNIGLVSPELHLFFDRTNTAFEVVASGLFDTIGLFRQLSADQTEMVSQMLDLLHLHSIRAKPLFQLSLGEQRMVLLARALVKNPPLLILDEPCQGLDETQALTIRNLIDACCANNTRSLLYVSHYNKDVPACITHYLQLKNGTAIATQQ